MAGLQDKYFEVSHTVRAADRQTVWAVLGEWLGRRYIARTSAVLDLGAGHGFFINNVRADKKYAVDQSPVIKDRAAKDVTVLVRDCSDLSPIKSDSLDVVFASNLLEHLDRPRTERTLEEVRRVLRPNGRLILLQPNFTYSFRHYFDDFTHQQIFTHIGLGDLLMASGFRIERVYPKFLPFSMRQGLPVASWLVRLYLASPWKPLAGQMLIVAQK